MPATRVTVVIADNAGSVPSLRRCIGGDGNVEILAECFTGLEALTAIRRYRPDLAFLSVALPALGGFDVARALGDDLRVKFVFLTDNAYEASTAFAYGALDCIARPLARDRVAVTVRRARERIESDRKPTAPESH